MGEAIEMTDPAQIESLTEDQQRIVRSDANAEILVNAGAGTGKTHVLIERLVNLVDNHDLFAGTDLLILSFSRAAVSEIRTRLKQSASSASYAGVATFDSFATRLLSLVDPDGSWISKTYEHRITAAAKAIETSPEAKELISGYKHILIDEIQDLVGSRAEMVMTLLTNFDGGFTLFGDPAQSIYDHQVANTDTSTSSSDLYEFVRHQLGDAVMELTLKKNFRAIGDLPRKALSFGPRLQPSSSEHSDVRSDLYTFIHELPMMGNLDSVIDGLRNNPNPSDAILCRSNAQALAILTQLSKETVPCRLKSSATLRAAPSWIGAATAGISTSRIGRSSLIGHLEETATADADISAEAKWKLLKRVEGRRGNDLDLRNIATRLSNQSLPQELYEENCSGITISTIHRAKGLEFDRVMITWPEPLNDDADVLEETRVLYVALTRARHWMGMIDSPDCRRFRRDPRTQRVVRSEYRGRACFTKAIEVRPNDTDRRSPPIPNQNCSPDDAGEIQKYLRESVKPGDPIELHRQNENGGDAVFNIEHAGNFVGHTALDFNRDIAQLFSQRIPRSLTGIVVDSIETLAGSPEETRRLELGSSGLWLSIRPVGLGTIVSARTSTQDTW